METSQNPGEKNPPSWDSADPLWKINDTDSLVSSWHSSVTAPKLKSIGAALKGVSAVVP